MERYVSGLVYAVRYNKLHFINRMRRGGDGIKCRQTSEKMTVTCHVIEKDSRFHLISISLRNTALHHRNEMPMLPRYRLSQPGNLLFFSDRISLMAIRLTEDSENCVPNSRRRSRDRSSRAALLFIGSSFPMNLEMDLSG